MDKVQVKAKDSSKSADPLAAMMGGMEMSSEMSEDF